MARNFGQLKDAVEELVMDLPAATVAEIPNLVNRAMRVAQEAHNWNACMKALHEVTTVEGNDLLSLPADFKTVRADPYFVTEQGEFRCMSWLNSDDEVQHRCSDDSDSDTGEPALLFYDERRAGFRVCPWPNGASDYDNGEYRIKIPYWKYLPAMVNDADTNWFGNNAEWFVIWGAASEAHAFNEWPDRDQKWTTKANSELRRLIRLDKRLHFPRRVNMPISRDVYGSQVGGSRCR